MVKKSYIIPSIEVSFAEVEQIIAASVMNIDGDTNLGLGDGEIPDEADVRELDDDFLDWD